LHGPSRPRRRCRCPRRLSGDPGWPAVVPVLLLWSTVHGSEAEEERWKVEVLASIHQSPFLSGRRLCRTHAAAGRPGLWEGDGCRIAARSDPSTWPQAESSCWMQGPDPRPRDHSLQRSVTVATFRPNLYRIGSSAPGRVADVGISGGGGEAPSTGAGVPEGRLHVGGQETSRWRSLTLC
jgi:hypothetical protein